MRIPSPRTAIVGVVGLWATAPIAAQSVRIDFESFPGPDGVLGTADDVPISAPSSFALQSEQLSDEYSPVGVLFVPGTGIDDRNEILDDSFFGSPGGHSSPNVLASAGIEEIEGVFTMPVASLSATIGIGPGVDEMEIFDAAGQVLGRVSSSGGSPVTLRASVPIARFVVRNALHTGSSTPTMDDLVFERGGPRLTVSGDCPGLVTLDVQHATPSNTVMIGWSRRQGTTTIPAGFQCAGAVLDLAGAQMLFALGTSPQGNTSYSLFAPPGACGVWLQAVDLASCTTSNVALVN